MIRLYIFESVNDALAFERKQDRVEVDNRTIVAKGPTHFYKNTYAELGGGVNEDPEPEPERVTPHAPRKNKRRKKANPEKEKVKERILAKAKSKSKTKGARTCKNCGKTGHMAKTCPETSPKHEKPGDLTQEQLNYIKDMADAGKSVAEIVMETGLPSQVVKENMY